MIVRKLYFAISGFLSLCYATAGSPSGLGSSFFQELTPTESAIYLSGGFANAPNSSRSSSTSVAIVSSLRTISYSPFGGGPSSNAFPNSVGGHRCVYSSIQATIFCIGGRNSMSDSSTDLDGFWTLNVTTQTWSLGTFVNQPIQPKFYRPSLVLMGSSKVAYLFGGLDDSSDWSTALFSLDFSSHSQLPQDIIPIGYSTRTAPSTRMSHCSVPVSSDTFLIMLGNTGTTALNDFWVFNTTSRIWRNMTISTATGSPSFQPRTDASCILQEQNQSVYISGGRQLNGGGSTGTVFPDIWILNLSSWQLSLVNNTMQTPRFGHSSAIIGSNLIIQGGLSSDSSLVSDAILLFDTSSNSFNNNTPSSIPPPTFNNTASGGGGGNIPSTDINKEIAIFIVSLLAVSFLIMAVLIFTCSLIHSRSKPGGKKMTTDAVDFDQDINSVGAAPVNAIAVEEAAVIAVSELAQTSKPITTISPPGTRHIAVREHRPNRSDELALEIGEEVIIFKQHSDQWAVGMSALSRRKGVFPLVCISSIHNSDSNCPKETLLREAVIEALKQQDRLKGILKSRSDSLQSNPYEFMK